MTEKNDTSRLNEKYIFRNIRQEEIPQAAEIEKICFPPNEACSYEHMEKRVEKAPELFLVAEDRTTGRIAGFLNGLATDREHLTDDFFTDAEMHDPKGRILCFWDWMYFRNISVRDWQGNWCAAIKSVKKQTAEKN